MNGVTHTTRALPRTTACAFRFLSTRRIFKAMRVCPGAFRASPTRCRARCKSRRGHSAEVFFWRLDF